MNNKHKKTSLALLLSFALGCTLPMVASANTGGFWKDDPVTSIPIYVAGSDPTPSTTGGNVFFDNGGSNMFYSVYGGYATGAGIEVGDNKAKVNIDIGFARGLFGGYSEAGNAINNTLEVHGLLGFASTNVYGGASKSGNANNNIIIAHGTNMRNVYGGRSESGNANNNSIYFHDVVEVVSYIAGGYVDSGVGSATGNTVTISGGAIGRAGTGINVVVYGGRADTGATTDNTVNVYGGRFIPEAEIYGGSNNVNFSGNTLNWAHQATVAKVANFANYNFYIPENTVAGETLLTVAGGDSTDLSGSTVSLVGVKGIREWQEGESVVLIDNQDGIDGQDSIVKGKTKEGLKLYKYEIEKSDDNTQLIATIAAGGIGDYAKSLSEGRIAAIGFINTAADLASGSGLQNAIDSSSTKYDLFGAMNYSDSRYNSGSHADVKGNSMLLGFSRKIENKNSNWVVGAFIESGNSSYETVNNFADFDGDVRANGKNNYFGGGIMARNVQKSGMYVDGSLRFGRMSTDYNSNDIEAKYDIKSTYYGLHLGVGKVFKLNNSNDLDVYGKYFWSHQNAATANIDGDSFNFDSINSHRLRIGGRLNMLGGGNGIKTYVGLAYEHEFSGSARATYSGENIAAPSIKGATGIGEIGMVYKPSTKSAFSMDVGLNGFIGKRQGIGGGVKLNWGF